VTTRVCVPYRGDGGGWRDRSWQYVRSWWQAAGWQVHTGDTPGPFNRAAARNAAAAGSWDVAVFADSDTILLEGTETVADAVELAHATSGAVLPHRRYIALTSRGTQLLLAGKAYEGHTKYEKADTPLGIVVVSRAAWEATGGFDERWRGWGGEDVAFRIACSTLARLDRLDGTLLHLWHPRDATKGQYIAARGGPLREAYRKADGDPAALRKLLEDR